MGSNPILAATLWILWRRCKPVEGERAEPRPASPHPWVAPAARGGVGGRADEVAEPVSASGTLAGGQRPRGRAVPRPPRRASGAGRGRPPGAGRQGSGLLVRGGVALSCRRAARDRQPGAITRRSWPIGL